MTFQAIFERASDGSIWGYCPDVPGASGAGNSLEEARESLRKGIALWIEAAKESGEEFPVYSDVVAIERIDVSTV
ncbi:MAG: type II toxin-antitoxin system HicB family antitoxin [Candidatus Eremiobacteraeota bacterium]|nr:type II toxin-antitoxin system HicB family antitoxin [Candidatus Eremiobacteraeota bacterium]